MSNNINTTAELSAEMKTYYEKRLIDLASPKLVHDQFGDRYPIPKNGGKTIEFRKYSPLEKATAPITEGVTPDGNSLSVSTVTAEVEQYGDWIGMSDMLDMTAIDNNVVQVTRLLGSQAGRTLDTITREELSGGTNVIFAPKVSGSTVTEVTSREALDSTAKLTPDLIFKAKTELAAMNADTIDDCYVAIIHPYAAYDLMRSEEWKDVHKYAQPENIYNGEIGKLGGVRFIETSEAKIFSGANLTAGARNLTVKTANAAGSESKTIAVKEKIASTDSLVGREVLIGGTKYTVESVSAADAGSATITIDTAIAVAADTVIYPGEGGADGLAVFSTLVLGAHAYGLTEITGGGLEHIVKQLGYGDDPLNQRSSCGWKATKAAKRLVEPYMIRIESCSSFSSTAKAN